VRFTFLFYILYLTRDFCAVMRALLMVVTGGSGNCAGALLGTELVMALRYSITADRYALYESLFFPIAYLENLLLGALMIFLIFRPQRLIAERAPPRT